MGDFTAKTLSIFWTLTAFLFYSAPLLGDEIHDGILMTDEPRRESESTLDEDLPAPAGAVVGNVPVKETPKDYSLKNLKPSEYPIEFLIPFMKMSQVLKKKVPAKEAPRLRSEMAGPEEKKAAERSFVSAKDLQAKGVSRPAGTQAVVKSAMEPAIESEPSDTSTSEEPQAVSRGLASEPVRTAKKSPSDLKTKSGQLLKSLRE